ncbi:hypothetical protein [Streptomyces sp. NK15101]|uniref:hypothetical protein n=1 Tax=Streptomyces sp. NK15101 TaxID=2873261 RepID=UPI001CECC620|nr:hypothetical protein [Streptomyces sp. NK15101]
MPGALELLVARTGLDLRRRHSTRARPALVVVPLALGALTPGLELGEATASALTVAGAF